MEAAAEATYRKILRDVVVPHLGNTTTYSRDLDTFCRYMLGKRWAGVYPGDQVPQLGKGECCVANLDPADKPGSHWVALVRRRDGRLQYYDSFGRPYADTLGRVAGDPGRLADNDGDAEQRVDELNCGARCVAYLLVCQSWGDDVGRLI